MRNYKLKHFKTNFTDIALEKSGEVFAKIVVEEASYVKCESTYTKGKRMMFLDLIPKVARLTPREADILTFILYNTNKKCYVYSRNSKKYINNAYISSELKYSKQTVSTAIKKMINLDILKRDNRKLVVNPYLYMPYGINELKLGFLQRWWDSNLTYNYDEDLEDIDKQIEKATTLNTPKSKLH
jgi:predicted transcriptional regulator